jgi:hypothetical protein
MIIELEALKTFKDLKQGVTHRQYSYFKENDPERAKYLIELKLAKLISIKRNGLLR